jgi:chromosome segregation ATPase
MSDDPTTVILAAITELRTDVTGLRTGMTDLRTDMAGLHTRVDRLGTDMTGLHGSVDRLRGDMMGRMDRLQNSITSLQDDVTVNFGHADRIERVARGASDEIRALGVEVTAMERQIQHLQAQVRALRGEG